MSKNTRGETREEAFKRASHWNDEMIKWEKRDMLTNGQFVGGMERWDLQWDIDRLERLVEVKDKEIGALRFDVAMLKAELNSVRGKKA